MNLKGLAATAVLTVGAVGLTTGTAAAAPATLANIQPTVSSVRLAQGDTVVASLRGGHFAVSNDGRAVTVSDRDGRTVTTLPMAYRLAGRTVPLRPAVGPSGTTLTLTPVGAPSIGANEQAKGRAQFVDYNRDLARHQYNAGVGALIGAAVGGLIGFVFLGIGAIPGILIGALVGAGIGWISP